MYKQLAGLLRDRILSGEYEEGQQIPSEIELARDYDISRMTARRAVEVLAGEKLIIRNPGKGSFVSRKKTPYSISTYTSFSKSLQKLGLTVGTKILALEIMDATIELAEDLEVDIGTPLVLVKRLRFLEGQPAAYHASYLPASLFAGLIDMSSQLQKEPMADIMEEVSGLKIKYTRDYLEASSARPSEAILLNVDKGSPVLIVRGIAYAKGDLPIRATKAVFRGDYFKFSIEPNIANINNLSNQN